ncbi:hypothetical protein HRE53_20485 [Acaryochloris sp. 'Moss Beach']|uniref:hypothetical protein n=1 Tax=Acaryochloris sp. 'Moss Beach' TaxID=2740837 RepID=UPI001F3EA24E|nr:hypothetical protein [Acaryochloris sp. 'Moss Beach']UJB68808.1 hypothetical protein HRE53_20485 [Acaryochloris sp. 'Moss Beach']
MRAHKNVPKAKISPLLVERLNPCSQACQRARFIFGKRMRFIMELQIFGSEVYRHNSIGGEISLNGVLFTEG